MAQILNSVKSSNKEYSETKYKYEKEIKEYKDLIKKEENKKLDGWLVEKKEYIINFNKNYFWFVNVCLTIDLLLFIACFIYFYIYYQQTFFSKIICVSFVLTVLFFLQYLFFYFIRFLTSNEYIKKLNMVSDNKIQDYEERIKELKKHFKTTFTGSKFIEKNKFLENHGKKDFVNFVKKNFTEENVYLINDFTNYYNNEILQIDHILITNKGIFCIEIKSGNKVYYPSTNNKWKYYSQDTECEIENPQETITLKSENLENLLGNLCLQIIPTVVFTNPDSGFIGETTNKCKILNMDELPDYYKEKKIMFSDEQVQSIAKMIFEQNLKRY